ncbi:MAG: hypothetical protein CL714_05815 [Chloroflexi bacterium]|nr:hypothetical protein [Chloroflexota bacterium]
MKKECIIIFFLSISFSSMNTIFQDIEYIKREIQAIDLESIREDMVFFPFYINNNEKTINLKPILAIRNSQVGFELDSINAINSITWISPGLSVELYKPFINPISSFIIYGWSDFYKHSMYGMTEFSDDYFKFNPDYYIGYSSESQWDNDLLKNGIDFDENIYGLLIKNNLFEFKIGNYSPRLGPFLSSNLFLSGQYPAFSNIHFKLYGKNIQYHLLYGDLESKILTDPNDNDSFFQPRTVYYHRLDFYIKKNFRISIFESIISGHSRIDLSYLNPLSFYWSSQHTKADKDNLLMGFDWEYIMRSWRLYGAFIMDEWAPTKAFGPNEISKDNNNHNWFGYQFGITKMIKLAQTISLIKIEFAATSPNLYSHDLERNIPQHHNYNLGYWSGGNTENWNIYINTILSDKVSTCFSYIKNAKGESGYNVDNNINTDLWIKESYKFGLEYVVINDKLSMDINYNIISSCSLYGSKIDGIDFAFRYNINY